MNKIQVIDSIFNWADLSIEEYLRAKGKQPSELIKLYSTEEVAEMFGIHRNTLSKLKSEGKIQHVAGLGKVRYSRTDVMQFIETNTKRGNQHDSSKTGSQ